MATILEFKKRGGERPHHRSSDPASHLVRAKTNSELFMEAYEDVIGDWQRFAAKNKLSEYVASKLPENFRISNTADYVNDLNVCSHIEQRLGMKVSVFYPGCTHQNQHGWLATFHLKEEVFSTPPDMVSEANARALLIVLFIHFKSVMKSLDREIS